ncbi:MAG TPA: hypothetical protein VGP33_03465 [Chloroflexota bacterium]|jgi:hypothetical protein|nr:hypothetical protein [Chloroflexota bacterium]
MAMSGGSRLTAALTSIAAKLQSGHEVRVGFLAGSTYPDGTSTPLVATVQEFGAPSRGIPPRPFFRTAIKTNSPKWGPKLGAVLKAHDYDANKALSLMGEGIKGEIQQSIVDLVAPPLAPATVAAKGSTKPLIDTGHMLNSVDWEVK